MILSPPTTPILPEPVEASNRPSAGSGNKVVFFGNERLSTGLNTIKAKVLPALIESGFDILAVVSNNQNEGNGSKRIHEIEQIAKLHNIPLLSPKNPIDIADQLRALEPDIGVLVAYGRIVPQTIIDLFPLGIINLHPSLLPLYRGSTPIEQVMLDGPAKTGVSIMGLATKMDAGPVFAQTDVNLTGTEQKTYLAEYLLGVGSEMIMALLKDIKDSLNNFSIQNEKLATYTPQIKKSDGLLDWTKPAERLEREIRAYLGWPGSYTTLAKKSIIVTNASVIDLAGPPGKVFKHEKQLGIFTGQNALIINRLKPAGKREMTGQEFLAGNQI